MSENSHDMVEGPESTFSQRKLRPDDRDLPVPPIALPEPSNLWWFFIIGVFLLPFSMMAILIIATREWISVDKTAWDFIGGGVSVAAGVLCVWQLPIPRLARLMISVVYAPIVGLLLALFSLGFVMQRYGAFL